MATDPDKPKPDKPKRDVIRDAQLGNTEGPWNVDYGPDFRVEVGGKVYTGEDLKRLNDEVHNPPDDKSEPDPPDDKSEPDPEGEG